MPASTPPASDSPSRGNSRVAQLLRGAVLPRRRRQGLPRRLGHRLPPSPPPPTPRPGAAVRQGAAPALWRSRGRARPSVAPNNRSGQAATWLNGSESAPILPPSPPTARQPVQADLTARARCTPPLCATPPPTSSGAALEQAQAWSPMRASAAAPPDRPRDPTPRSLGAAGPRHGGTSALGNGDPSPPAPPRVPLHLRLGPRRRTKTGGRRSSPNGLTMGHDRLGRRRSNNAWGGQGAARTSAPGQWTAGGSTASDYHILHCFQSIFCMQDQPICFRGDCIAIRFAYQLRAKSLMYRMGNSLNTVHIRSYNYTS